MIRVLQFIRIAAFVGLVTAGSTFLVLWYLRLQGLWAAAGG